MRRRSRRRAGCSFQRPSRCRPQPGSRGSSGNIPAASACPRRPRRHDCRRRRQTAAPARRPAARSRPAPSACVPRSCRSTGRGSGRRGRRQDPGCAASSSASSSAIVSFCGLSISCVSATMRMRNSPFSSNCSCPSACAARAAGTRETSSTAHSASAASILNFFKADRLFIYRLKSIVADSSPRATCAAGMQKSRRRPGGSFCLFQNPAQSVISSALCASLPIRARQASVSAAICSGQRPM